MPLKASIISAISPWALPLTALEARSPRSTRAATSTMEASGLVMRREIQKPTAMPKGRLTARPMTSDHFSPNRRSPSQYSE
jgi:hypothetical protein